jgi:aerobic-type carbon monoxide dehydrogenase small subunit (CoxS/CutS family)
MSQEEKRTSDKKESSLESAGRLSRRQFTLSSMAVLGARVASAEPRQTAAPKSPGTGPPDSGEPSATGDSSPPSATTNIRITVNGWDYEIPVRAEWVLREVLRERLGILSVKDMCNGLGACGSCSVLMNGRVVLSCMTLAIQCDGATIETAEGIAASNPELIEAYAMNHAMQCGYCTPGFVVTAKALLDRTPKPSEQEIRAALAGNICRCGTYPQHIIAIKETSESL